MTKKQIKSKIKNLVQEKEYLNCSANDPSVLKLRAEIANLKFSLHEADERFREKNASKVKAIDDEIEKLRLELAKPGGRSLITEIPVGLLPKLAQRILDKAGRRYSDGKKYSFIWISPKGRYGIMRAPGSTYWSGSEQKYGQSQFALVDLTDETSSPYGFGCENKNLPHHDGRFSKSLFEAWKIKAEELES